MGKLKTMTNIIFGSNSASSANSANKPAFGAKRSEIKKLVQEYRTHGDEFSARFLENMNNTRESNPKNSFFLFIKPIDKIKEFVESVLVKKEKLESELTNEFKAKSDRIKLTQSPQQKDLRIHMLQKAFLPKSYKGSADNTLNIMEKANENPTIMQRLVWNKIFRDNAK